MFQSGFFYLFACSSFFIATMTIIKTLILSPAHNCNYTQYRERDERKKANKCNFAAIAQLALGGGRDFEHLQKEKNASCISRKKRVVIFSFLLVNYGAKRECAGSRVLGYVHIYLDPLALAGRAGLSRASLDIGI